MNTLEFKPQTLRDRLEMEMNSVHSNRILKSLETIKKIFLLANAKPENIQEFELVAKYNVKNIEVAQQFLENAPKFVKKFSFVNYEKLNSYSLVEKYKKIFYDSREIIKNEYLYKFSTPLCIELTELSLSICPQIMKIYSVKDFFSQKCLENNLTIRNQPLTLLNASYKTVPKVIQYIDNDFLSKNRPLLANFISNYPDAIYYIKSKELFNDEKTQDLLISYSLAMHPVSFIFLNEKESEKIFDETFFNKILNIQNQLIKENKISTRFADESRSIFESLRNKKADIQENISAITKNDSVKDDDEIEIQITPQTNIEVDIGEPQFIKKQKVNLEAFSKKTDKPVKPEKTFDDEFKND